MIQRVPVPLTGGVNTEKDPTRLSDEQLMPSPNLCARRGGLPGLRPSLQSVREIVPDYRPWNSARYDAGASTEVYTQWARYWRPMRFLFSPFGGEIAAIMQATEAKQIINSDADTAVDTPKIVPEQSAVLWMLPSLYAGGDTNGGPYCFDLGLCTRAPSLFVFNGIIYAFGGGNAGGHIRPSTTWSVGATLGWDYAHNDFGPDNADFIPHGAAVVRDRVVYYIGPNLFWSDRNDPLSVSLPGEVATAARNLLITGEELEDITAVSELSTSAEGSPTQSILGVWTKSRCYFVMGEPLETTDTSGDLLGTLQVSRLNIEAGCVSQATVTRTPYGTFWVGQDDVWFMPYGALPIRVGTNIRRAIKNMPPSLQYRICADYEDGFYRIALASEGNGPDAASPLDQQWWLDLNDGPPSGADSAKWWGPMNLVNGDAPNISGSNASGMWCFARDSRATGDGKLYSLQPYMMAGEGTGIYGTIYGMTLCGWDQYRATDMGAPRMEPVAWQANTNYFEGDIVVPTPSSADFRSPSFVCTTTGTSGGSEPNWLAAAGATVTDNTAVWRPIYYDGLKSLSSYKCLAAQDNAIEMELNTKEYIGDPMVEKMLDGAELSYWTASPTQVTYSTNPDQQSRSRILGQYGDALMDSSTSFGGLRNFQRKLLTPDPTKRFNAGSAMAKIKVDAGYVIETGFNDTISFSLNGGATIPLTIPAGYYEDILDLWDAIKAAATTAGLTLTSLTDADGGFINRAVWGIRSSSGTLTIVQPGLLGQYFGYNGINLSAAYPSYVTGDASYARQQLTDFQIAGLALRVRPFGRRPQ